MSDFRADFDAAVARARSMGVGRCDDLAAMAAFCADTVQLLAGAVSPSLVWAGARQEGLTFAELAKLAAENPSQVADLMWV